MLEISQQDFMLCTSSVSELRPEFFIARLLVSQLHSLCGSETLVHSRKEKEG